MNSKVPGKYFYILVLLPHSDVFYLTPTKIIKCLRAIHPVSFFQRQLADF